MTTFYEIIKNDFMKKRLEGQVVQEFPYRCPYCDQEVSYEKIKLRVGENVIECPSCKKKYIKVVADGSPPPSPSPIKGEGKILKKAIGK